jgi:hypothetical protein
LTNAWRGSTISELVRLVRGPNVSNRLGFPTGAGGNGTVSAPRHWCSGEARLPLVRRTFCGVWGRRRKATTFEDKQLESRAVIYEEPSVQSLTEANLSSGRSDDEPYGMFKDLRKYSWVLDIHRYDDQEDLLNSLVDRVIRPAEAKAQELSA